MKRMDVDDAFLGKTMFYIDWLTDLGLSGAGYFK